MEYEILVSGKHTRTAWIRSDTEMFSSFGYSQKKSWLRGREIGPSFQNGSETIQKNKIEMSFEFKL